MHYSMIKKLIENHVFSNFRVNTVIAFESLSIWVAKNPSFLHADSEDSDQTGQMPRLN